MAPSESFEEYIDRVRAHRAELRAAVTALDLSLSAPLGRITWIEDVHSSMVELARDFADHIELTQRPGGIYETVRSTQSRLSEAVDQLIDEHASLAAEIKACLDALEVRDHSADLRAIREEITELVGLLVRHRQRGGDLVYEAYSVDIGGQG